LALLIEKAFTDSDGTYGYRRLHAQLARWDEHCTPELVRALMRALGLVACHRWACVSQSRRERVG
jgi:hypothetical protein